MIPMTCPNCGRHGSAPSDRAKVRMNCKKCGVIFYLDETGKVLLGDPEEAERAARAKLAHPPSMPLVAVLKKTPTPVRFLAVASALILLPFAMGYRIDFDQPPLEREARFEYLVRAFLTNSVSSVEKVSAPGTIRNARPWLVKIRSKLQLRVADTDPTATVKPIMIGDTESTGRIEVVLQLSNLASQPRLPAASSGDPMRLGSNPDGSLDIPTVWILAGEDLWAFEPNQSLEFLK